MNHGNSNSKNDAESGIAVKAEVSTSGRLLALTAALLGWLFDGFEMGLFPVIARPALRDLLSDATRGWEAPAIEALVSSWNGIVIAGFLIGASAGGVLFGWLGDRIGRVRAMSLSILTYALVSAVGAWAQSPLQIVVIRFVAALGMGGEWSLGVALVMEIWPGRSRALLAGLIGAGANLGYALVAWVSLTLGSLRQSFTALGFSESWVEWRLLMVCGILPAGLTLFVRLYVPESRRWEEERAAGRTRGWRGRDLFGVAAGVAISFAMVYVWSQPAAMAWKWLVTGGGLALVAAGYLLPVFRYLQRTDTEKSNRQRFVSSDILRRMLIGALLSGIPLLGTWSSVQWATFWADQLAGGAPHAKAYTQLLSALAAAVGGFVAAYLGIWFSRRLAYLLLSLASWGSVWIFYQTCTQFDGWFLAKVSLMGFLTAAFYGWLPLYLPELFPTRVRATGQGFSFNFGRILAAIGAMQTSAILGAFEGGYPQACTMMASIYFLGALVIWVAPETAGRPLPD